MLHINMVNLWFQNFLPENLQILLKENWENGTKTQHFVHLREVGSTWELRRYEWCRWKAGEKTWQASSPFMATASAHIITCSRTVNKQRSIWSWPLFLLANIFSDFWLVSLILWNQPTRKVLSYPVSLSFARSGNVITRKIRCFARSSTCR